MTLTTSQVLTQAQTKKYLVDLRKTSAALGREKNLFVAFDSLTHGYVAVAALKAAVDSEIAAGVSLLQGAPYNIASP